MRLIIGWRGNENGDLNWRADSPPYSISIRVEEVDENEKVTITASHRDKRVKPIEQQRATIEVRPESVRRLIPSLITVDASSEAHAEDRAHGTVLLIPPWGRRLATLFAFASLLLAGVLGWVVLKLPSSGFFAGMKLLLASGIGSVVIGQLISLRDPRSLPYGGIFHDIRRAGIVFILTAVAVVVIPRYTLTCIRNGTAVTVTLPRDSDPNVELAPSDEIVVLGRKPISDAKYFEAIPDFDDRFCAARSSGPKESCVSEKRPNPIVGVLGIESVTIECRQDAFSTTTRFGAHGRYVIPRERDCVPNARAKPPSLSVSKLMAFLRTTKSGERLKTASPELDATFTMPSVVDEAGRKRMAELDDDAELEKTFGQLALLQVKPAEGHSHEGAVLVAKGGEGIPALNVSLQGGKTGWTLLPHPREVAWFALEVHTRAKEHVRGTVECATSRPGDLDSYLLWQLPFTHRRLGGLTVVEQGSVVSRWAATDDGAAWMCTPTYRAETSTAVSRSAELRLQEGWTAERGWKLGFPAAIVPSELAIFSNDHRRIGTLVCGNVDRKSAGYVDIGPIEMAATTAYHALNASEDPGTKPSWHSGWVPEPNAGTNGTWPWVCRPRGVTAMRVSIDPTKLIAHYDNTHQRIVTAAASGPPCWQLTDAPTTRAEEKFNCKAPSKAWLDQYAEAIERAYGCDRNLLKACER